MLYFYIIKEYFRGCYRKRRGFILYRKRAVYSSLAYVVCGMMAANAVAIQKKSDRKSDQYLLLE